MIPTRERIIIISFVLLALSAAVSLVAFSSQYKEREVLRGYLAAFATEERLGSAFSAINDFPGSAGKDMLFLRTLSSLSNIHNSFTEGSWREAYQDLQQFIDRNPAYAEILIHVGGLNCTVSVKRISDDDGDASCGARDDAIDTTLASLETLPAGSVYISALYDHVHRAKGEETHLPALQYATRISAEGSAEGAVVAVIDANYFLDEVRRLGRDDEPVFLLNQDGSYIAHPDPSQEKLAAQSSQNASMGEAGEANFYREYPEVSPDVLSDTSIKRFETKNRVFTFMRITPTASNFALYDGHEARESEYWVMVAVSDKPNSGPWWASLSYLVAAAVIIAVHVIVAGMLRIALFPVARRS